MTQYVTLELKRRITERWKDVTGLSDHELTELTSILNEVVDPLLRDVERNVTLQRDAEIIKLLETLGDIESPRTLVHKLAAALGHAIGPERPGPHPQQGR